MAKLILDDSLYTKVAEENLVHISCISHKTKFEKLKSIFEMGLLPGGIGTNSPAHINFTPFPTFDMRNLASGMRGEEFDVVIVFQTRGHAQIQPGTVAECRLGIKLERPVGDD